MSGAKYVFRPNRSCLKKWVFIHGRAFFTGAVLETCLFHARKEEVMAGRILWRGAGEHYRSVVPGVAVAQVAVRTVSR